MKKYTYEIRSQDLALVFKNIADFSNKENQTLEELKIRSLMAQQIDALNELVGGDFYECDCSNCKIREKLGFNFIPKPD
jgi:hypothetical protein